MTAHFLIIISELHMSIIDTQFLGDFIRAKQFIAILSCSSLHGDTTSTLSSYGTYFLEILSEVSGVYFLYSVKATHFLTSLLELHIFFSFYLLS